MTFTYDAGTSTPNLAGLVEFNGVRINDGTYVLTHLAGLQDSPPVRGVSSDLPADHGGFAGNPFYSPLVIDIEGYLTVPTLADVWPAMDALRAAFNLDAGSRVLTFDTLGFTDTRFVTAQLAGPIVFIEPDMLDKNVPDRAFTIPLIAADPRAYSTTLTTTTISSGTSVTNGGTASSPLVVRFTGPQTNPQVVGPGGGTVRYGDVVGSGSWVEVTVNPSAVNGVTALDDGGTSVYPAIETLSAYAVPPGSSSWTATRDSGAGATTIKHRDAWA